MSKNQIHESLKDLATPINTLKYLDKNARKGYIGAIKRSYEQFGQRKPIVATKDGTVIAGNHQLQSAKELGWDKIAVVFTNDDELTAKAFALADNRTSELGGYDKDFLAEMLSAVESDEEMFKATGFTEKDIAELIEVGTKQHGKLHEVFVVPPFSVLDTRQGYWQDRKKAWNNLIGNASDTKENVLTSGEDSLLSTINEGSSNFDPVLAELIMRWFCIKGGKVLDAFGGEQTKGVVAGELGLQYSAVEIRKEQVELNNLQTSKYNNVKYFLGDSNNIDELIKERDFNLCFTSPPYYDLEVYSKNDMSALGSYEEFMQQYENIFTKCYEMLADNSFMVVKVGEIRDKQTGEYRNFVGDNISLFKRIGFTYYNELTLVNAYGTAPQRANRMMKTRKMVKLHQNILVFYKGNIKNINKVYHEIEVDSSVNGL